MTCSTWINRWIAGAFISALVLTGQALPAHASIQGGEETQDVFLRVESRWDAEVIAEFRHRLTEYDAVRRRLDASLPPMPVAADPATIFRVAQAHHGALLSARYSARQGDIFFTRIADRFRDWIRVSLHHMPPNVFIAMITEPDAPPMGRPGVNDSYPEGGALTTMPPEMLKLFPALPEGLEYRFIDRDLILWDVHANLIVDFIPDALALSDLTSRHN